MTSLELITDTDWIISITGYFIGAVLAAYLMYEELKKRKHIKILSWNGRTRNKNKHLNSTTTSLEPSMQSESKTGNKIHEDPQFLVGSLHYISIIIYIFSFFLCIVGIQRCFSQICGYFVIASLTICVVITKAFILLFQWHRYVFCFVNNSKSFQNVNSNSNSSLLGRICVCDMRCLKKSLLCSAGFIFLCAFCFGIYISFVLAPTYILQNDLWCTYQLTSFAVYLPLVTLIVADWTTLFMYLVTILNLKNKISKFMQNENSTSGNNKNNKNIRRAMAKLESILVRILVCSLAMEVPFIISQAANSIATRYDDKQGIQKNVQTIKHVFLSLDALFNVIFVSLMMEHNRARYQKFMEYLKIFRFYICCCCCCNCFCKKNNRNLKDRKESNANDKNRKISKIESTMIPSNVNSMSDDTLGIERSYFVSEKSKTHTPISDPL